MNIFDAAVAQKKARSYDGGKSKMVPEFS